MALGYFDEMRRMRRQLLDKYWPFIEPAVTRRLKEQKTPLTQVQIEAVGALISEQFHLAKVDRGYLDMLIKRLEARVLGYESAQSRLPRYITVSDCESMTRAQFCRVIRHLFARFGYQGQCSQEDWLVLHHSSQTRRILAWLEVQNRIIHQHDMDSLLSVMNQRRGERAIFITVGSFGADVATKCPKAVELWDGNQLGALLDRVRLSPDSMLE